MSKAVLIIIFNRPSTTQKVFQALRKVSPERLYIAADAPRDGYENDEELCAQTRHITEQIDWPCEVKRLYQEKNLGCSLGPRAAFDWFFSHEKEGIILEDDCLPNPNFFRFADEMLNRYRNNPRIISINGSNLGFAWNEGSSYTYSRYMNMWGWATWADRAQQIDYSLHSWKNQKKRTLYLHQKMRQHIFDFDINWYKYWQHKFDMTIEKERITWWDWQWIYHQLKHRQLSIVPGKNLVTNIGFDELATHTQDHSNPAANIPSESIKFPLIHPLKIAPNFKYEEHIKWVWCYYKRLPFLFYIKHYVSKVLGRII